MRSGLQADIGHSPENPTKAGSRAVLFRSQCILVTPMSMLIFAQLSMVVSGLATISSQEYGNRELKVAENPGTETQVYPHMRFRDGEPGS